MNWWPFGRTEERSTSYTTLATSRATEAAEGADDEGALATAALEIACGIVSHSLAAARVKDAGRAEGALSPSVLSLMGRNLIRYGQDHHRILVRGGRLVLRPMAHAYAYGSDPDPMRWFYHGSMYAPTGAEHEWVKSGAVIHCRYAVESARPWVGIAPWRYAATTGSALAGVERLIAEKAREVHGDLLSTPQTPQIDEAGDVTPLDALRADLAEAHGGTVVIESPDKWDESAGRGMGSEKFAVTKFGLTAEVAHAVRSDIGLSVLSACGIPPSLALGAIDGTAQREALRRFLHTSLRPMARMMEDEFRLKFNAPNLTLDFADLGAADVAGRARSFKAFVESGMDPMDAARNTGVELERPMRTKKNKGVPDGTSKD